MREEDADVGKYLHFKLTDVDPPLILSSSSATGFEMRGSGSNLKK